MNIQQIYSKGGMILRGETGSTDRKTCSNANLSTINPAWTCLGVKPGLCCNRPATNRLHHGMALDKHLFVLIQHKFIYVLEPQVAI